MKLKKAKSKNSRQWIIEQIKELRPDWGEPEIYYYDPFNWTAIYSNGIYVDPPNKDGFCSIWIKTGELTSIPFYNASSAKELAQAIYSMPYLGSFKISYEYQDNRQRTDTEQIKPGP